MMIAVLAVIIIVGLVIYFETKSRAASSLAADFLFEKSAEKET
jgi:hypothetical protein